MHGWGTVIVAVDAVLREALLFASAGFLLGGIDDLAIDFLFLAHRLRPRPAPAVCAATPPAGDIAVLVPAWDESAVIADMLATALERWPGEGYRILVGAYPNDPATIAAVEPIAASDSRVRLVIGARPGPTTKADNLNTLWHALRVEEEAGWQVAAVVLHDAEDVVHPDELTVHRTLLADHDLVQLPVLPLIKRGSGRFVSGHYADEFAENHTRTMVVREAIGAPLPLAGTGCAIARAMLGRIADARGGTPFDATSLTEDYELGLHAGRIAGRAVFARARGRDGSLVAVRALFPDSVGASVRQKARWMTGIALAGWDRVGWGRWYALSDHWMRMRDRRALVAVLVLLVGYGAVLLTGASLLLHLAAGTPAFRATGWLRLALGINGVLLGWRLLVRAGFTGRAYGWRQALLAVPRVLVGNWIALFAARRALGDYWGMLHGRGVAWNKTAHEFPPVSH